MISTVEGAEVLGRAGASERASWIDRLFATVERLPGPPELFYAGLGVGSAAVAQAILWAFGYPQGVLEPEVLEPPLIGAFLLGLTHLVTRVGRSAFEDFRPALGESVEVDAYRRQLTSIPDRVALIAIALGVLVVLGGFLIFVAPYIAARPPVVDAVSGPMWTLTGATAGLFIVHDLRQLRAVSRMSAIAPRIDIFDASSSNAFSRLTVIGSVTLLLLVAAAVLTEPNLPTAYAVMMSGLALVAVATFVLPLRAMHDRLQQEKDGLMVESTARLKSVMAQLDAAVKQRDLSQADQLDKMLNAVLAERSVFEKLHTWPWSETTFRGFASALLLPLVIFVITRAIERVL